MILYFVQCHGTKKKTAYLSMSRHVCSLTSLSPMAQQQKKRTYTDFELDDLVVKKDGAPAAAGSSMSDLAEYKPRPDSMTFNGIVLGVQDSYEFSTTIIFLLLDPSACFSEGQKLGPMMKLDDAPDATPLWTRPDLNSPNVDVNVLRRMMGEPGRPPKDNRAHYFALDKVIHLFAGQVRCLIAPCLLCLTVHPQGMACEYQRQGCATACGRRARDARQCNHIYYMSIYRLSY